MSRDTSETTSIKQLETSSNKDDTSGWIAPSEWECLLLGEMELNLSVDNEMYSKWTYIWILQRIEKSAKVIIILLMLIFSMRVWVDAYNHDDKIDNFKGFHILGEESGIWIYKCENDEIAER